MSFRVKSAAVAALVISSLTATVASGVSMADDSVPSLPSPDVVTIASSPLSANAGSTGAIRFAPYKEVAQPIGQQAAAAPDSLSSAPRAEDILAVPERDYASLAALVRDVDTTAPLDVQAKCLATAIFYESRSESLEGQLAVARVIVNRERSARFGDDLCGVVTQPGQFSFVRNGVLPEVNATRAAFRTAVAIAHIAMRNAWESRAEGALYFHARRVSPSWGRKQVATIDNHIFYR